VVSPRLHGKSHICSGPSGPWFWFWFWFWFQQTTRVCLSVCLSVQDQDTLKTQASATPGDHRASLDLCSQNDASEMFFSFFLSQF